jgi:cysteinyl-tRNA synthetase
MSVPYRKQLNFTFDGLKQAAISVDRLRNFKRRLESEPFSEGVNDKIGALADETIVKMKAALDNDLNTAEMLAPLFDLVRDVNAAADAGEVKKGDVPSLLEALAKFDEIFAVLNDDDSRKVKFAVEWAEAEGKADQISPETAEMAKAAGLSDDKVEALVAEHSTARKAKDFKRSDAIRAELLESGIILENTKDGVRWKRK